MKPSKLEAITEMNDDLFYVRVENKGNFPVANGYGATLKEALKNLCDTINDYKTHEGKTDAFWKKVDTKYIEWDIRYDVQAFFEEFDYLNQSKIADLSGINPGLLRQYASGVKHPSADQAKKIEKTIHKVAVDLKAVALYA